MSHSFVSSSLENVSYNIPPAANSIPERKSISSGENIELLVSDSKTTVFIVQAPIIEGELLFVGSSSSFLHDEKIIDTVRHFR